MKYDIVKLMARRKRRKIRWKKRWVSGDSGGRLTFRSKKAGRLSDYRIYGNTVDGESVGDRTGNLFDGIQPVTNNTTDTRGFLRVWFRAAKEDNLSESIALTYGADLNFITTITRTFTMPSGYNRLYIKHNGAARDVTLIDIILETGKTYTISFKVDGYNPSIVDGIEITNIMLNAGSTALPYEPYGYRVPVTVSNGTDTLTTPIYLPEQIRKVGDEAEYIDYGEQKMHRIGADDIDVTLPALPTLPGTNVLSVGTAVQPSRVEVKGRIKAVGQETEPEPETAEPEQEAAEAKQE